MSERLGYENLGDQAAQAQLALLRESLAVNTYPDYPSQAQRFSCMPNEARLIAEGELGIPEGPWQMPQDAPPSQQEQRTLLQQGLYLDINGRPLHPWLEPMASDPTIGIVSGRGAYWHWGPNYTADNIVICQDHVLLIQRSDTGLWALPGGHIDPGEDPFAAALRELQEETGLVVDALHPATQVYQGPVADLRATAHAWPETTAFLRTIEGPFPSVTGADDAKAAAWVPLSSLGASEVLYGSHSFLLEQALEFANRTLYPPYTGYC